MTVIHRHRFKVALGFTPFVIGTLYAILASMGDLPSPGFWFQAMVLFATMVASALIVDSVGARDE